MAQTRVGVETRRAVVAFGCILKADPLDALMVWVWGVRKGRVRTVSKVGPEQLEG